MSEHVQSKKVTMGRILFLAFLLLAITMGVYAQNPIAQLKFEDAEKAFNEGDYTKALHYVEETEKRIGVTSKTLYLKIVSQDGLMADPSMRAQMRSALKTNVQKYLTALKDQAIDDKYRMVYAISKKLQEPVAENATPPNAYKQTAALKAGSNVARVLQAYANAVWGQVDPASVQSVVIEQEVYKKGTQPQRMQMKVAVGKLYMSTNIGALLAKTVYRNGTGYVLVGSGYKSPIGPAQLEKFQQATSVGHLLPRQFDPEALINAVFRQETYAGTPADVLALPDQELYFSQRTHLLIAQKTTTPNGATTIERYQDYRSVQGIQYPFTILTISSASAAPGAPALVNGAAAVQQGQAASEAAVSSAMGMLSNRKKDKGGRNNKRQGLAVIGAVPVPADPSESGHGAVSRLKAFQRVGPQVQSINGNAAGAAIRIKKVKSLVLNQPLADGDFE